MEPPPPAPFTLLGRAAHEGLLYPSLPDGPALLGHGCATVNAALGGHGPPCLAERWRSGSREATFLVANPEASVRWATGELVVARTTWPCLGGTLGTCLEDPLMIPPARDPGGTRTFTGDGWVLAFSGHNRCSLGGLLRLDLDHDGGDWSALTVEGIAWSAGGRQRATATLQKQLTPR